MDGIELTLEVRVGTSVYRAALPAELVTSVRREERPAPEKVDIEGPMRRWGEIAQRYDLPQVRHLTETRRRKLRSRLREMPDLFERVEAQLERPRCALFRERRMPTFDQIVRPDFLAKFLEGNYEGESRDERQRRGSSYSDSSAYRELDT